MRRLPERPEPGLFARDEHLAGLTRDEAVGHRIVIGPELQRKSLPEIDHDPVAAILHLPLFINRCVVHLVDPVAPHSGHRLRRPQHSPETSLTAKGEGFRI